MLVYRISQSKYSNSLVSPGVAARWNSAGQHMIYTGGSLALSCLEILVHKSGASLASGNFSVAVIKLDNNLKISEVTLSELVDLDEQWYLASNYYLTQEVGDNWLTSGESPVLKVPSAIIDLEYNYLLNPNHPDFAKIEIVNVSKFTFDPRQQIPEISRQPGNQQRTWFGFRNLVQRSSLQLINYY